MHSEDTINGSGFDARDGEELERQQGLRCKSRKREPAGGRKPGCFTLHSACPWLHGPKGGTR